ncbi:bifunctional [glutamate--ammonia ligase]-adenylyl-L-tyrosine phosphorylase/[glutamate--ammonia-ligase] adenylyltransferase [Paraglaciecola aestuariivivens]
MDQQTVSSFPASLQTLGASRWQSFCESYSEWPSLDTYQADICHAFGLSDFIFEQAMKHPSWIDELLIDNQLNEVKIDYQQALQDVLSQVENEVQLHQRLRLFRHFHMLRIAWLDLLNLQPIEASLVQVSELAKQLIVQTNQWLYQSLQVRLGTPFGQFGPQPLLILGMGKLGGNELNFSSDIDLIFTYPEAGETQGGKKTVENQQFFTKLAQKLISALNQITVDGQVYRVDMRLRPFGDSGPLVMHFDAMEDYYQEQGRDWERYAMLKAVILNPPCQHSKELSAILRPFIYRRYLDFSAIDSLRSMKNMIVQEVRRRGLSNNIKLGQGGIREAEFVVQSLQLINGGREPSLQVQSLQLALTELVNLQILPQDGASNIRTSYLWLRKVEHCLQQFADAQTQELPDDPLNQSRLVYVLGLNSYSEFLSHLREHCEQIHQQFSLLVKEEKVQLEPTKNEAQQASIDLWQLDLDPPHIQEILSHWVTTATTEKQDTLFCQQLAEFKQILSRKRVGQRGLISLNQLMPALLDCIRQAGFKRYGELLKRLLNVLQAVLGRTAYLQLLSENQGALVHLVKLCAASPWVTEQIARFPLLLDELLNPALLYQPVPLTQYSDELRQALLRVEPEDLELQIETLRQFKLSQQLKIAAADIAGPLPVMKVSDHLTYLAEALISQVVDIAWQQMVAKYGVPVCQTKGEKSMQDKGFAVIAYGKLGGWELGYGSDLDLVFVQNCDGALFTNGDKQLESRQFYLKLAQRILHIFTIKTGLGELYEVDMRLRPSGNSGLLVCHINSFKAYQTDDAWTWEHQALGRARFVYGSKDLFRHFNHIRHHILAKPRDIQRLAKEVLEMREKMREHLAEHKLNKIDLKQSKGGIADIEFLVQFMLLAHTQEYKSLSKWPDNVRILAELSKLSLLTPDEANDLTLAYLDYRNQAHRLALQNTKLAKQDDKLIAHQTKVSEIWQKYLVEPYQ